MEAEGKVLVIKRIKQTFHLAVPERDRETVGRVLSGYADSCPVARSLKGSIEISSTIEYAPT